MTRSCYASNLGDCSKRLSREHYISEAVLKQIGSFGGLERQGAGGSEWLPRSLNTMTARILCERHNSALSLSPLDEAGARLFRAIDVAEDELVDNKIERCSTRAVLDGDETERWLLKCAFGLCFGNQLTNSAQGTSIRRLREQDTLLRVLFGEPSTRCALHVECDQGSPFATAAPLGFQALSHGDELWGLRLSLRSIPLLLAFGNADRLASELRRPRSLMLARADAPHAQQCLEFTWRNHVGADLSFTRVGSVSVQPFPKKLPQSG